MDRLSQHLQEADWKTEKHVPVIECADAVKAGEFFEVRVSIGKEVAHPNTTEHHIRYISLFFQPEGERFTYQIGHFEFSAHGESVEGPDKGPVYTHHMACTSMKTSKPGTFFAMSYCNIHGLWQASREVKLLAGVAAR